VLKPSASPATREFQGNATPFDLADWIQPNRIAIKRDDEPHAPRALEREMTDYP